MIPTNRSRKAFSDRPGMTIEKVQQWIISALICAVASFPIGALMVTSWYRNNAGNASDAIMLSAMAAVIGTLAVGAGRLVHRLNPISLFILIGALPGLFTIACVVRA